MFSLSITDSGKDLKLFRKKIDDEDAKLKVHLIPVKGILWNGNVRTDWKNRTLDAYNVIMLEIFPMFKIEDTDEHFLTEMIPLSMEKSICVWTRTKANQKNFCTKTVIFLI